MFFPTNLALGKIDASDSYFDGRGVINVVTL